MRDMTLLLTVCLHYSVALSVVVHQPCQMLKDGLCSKGEYLSYNDLDEYTCVTCPANTFMDYDSHVCESCKNHTQPSTMEVVARRGNSTSDNSVVCRQGFFRARDSEQEKRAKCESCSVCKNGNWSARGCTPNRDTFCCLQGLTAVQIVDHAVCVLPLSLRSRRIQTIRKGRSASSEGHESGSNVTSDETANKVSSNKIGSADNLEETPAHETPAHETISRPEQSFSRAEEERKQEMVEFPLWGRFLVAGIAVAIFLFYLGVGIPCNACGSLDKLKVLKRMVFQRQDRPPTEQESKQPMHPKSHTGQV